MGAPKRKTEYSTGQRLFALFLALCLAASLLPGGLAAPARASDSAVVSCYASVDGIWHRVGTLSSDKRAWLGGKNQRYYVTADELETVYSAFGFQASEYAGQLYFPHTDTYDPKHIWADALPTSEDTAYEVDARIRASKTQPISGVFLDSTPSDESVLAALRSGGYTITIDGAEIPVDKITSENFTVRWSSMKYEYFDGWHVDGVLVAKSARFSVTKTFSGDDTAVAKVKEHWSAKITHVPDGDDRDLDVVTDYVLSLNSAEDESDPAKTGYTSYDPATDTYQWTLVARNKRQYTLTESGHTTGGTDLDPAQWEQSFQYSIRGSDSATGGSLPYADGVQLQAEAYPDDVPDAVIQTVELRNLYVRAGVLTLYKADSLTGDGIGGVQFSVTRADGGEMTLYRKPDTSSYYGQPDSEHTQPVENGLLTCDPNGYLYLKLAPYAGQTTGAYDLTELFPPGYEGAERLRITVTSDDLISFSSEVLSGLEGAPEGGWLS